MLPTSARVAQEVHEPLIGIQYPMLRSRMGRHLANRLALYAPPVEWVVLQEWSFPRIAAQILSLLVDLITTSAGASRDT